MELWYGEASIGIRSNFAVEHNLLDLHCWNKSFLRPGFRAAQLECWDTRLMSVSAYWVGVHTLHRLDYKYWTIFLLTYDHSNELRRRVSHASPGECHAYSWSRHTYERAWVAIYQCSRKVLEFEVLVEWCRAVDVGVDRPESKIDLCSPLQLGSIHNHSWVLQQVPHWRSRIVVVELLRVAFFALPYQPRRQQWRP